MTEFTKFQQLLETELQDAEFRRLFELESAKVRAIDDLMNRLDEARMNQGLNKASLAKLVGVRPEMIRRLFTANGVNPTLATTVSLAQTLGLRLVLQPIND